MADPEVTIPAGVTSLTLIVNIGSTADPRLDQILALLHTMQAKEEAMALDLTALTDAVSQESTVEQSAITLIEQLATAIQASAADQTAVTTLAQQINSNAQSLAAAVAANTPAAPAA